MTLIREKSELEDKEYNLTNRLKKLETRFNANEKQLLDTISENETLQTKLQKKNGSFISDDSRGETGESLMTLNVTQDTMKLN